MSCWKRPKVGLFSKKEGRLDAFEDGQGGLVDY